MSQPLSNVARLKNDTVFGHVQSFLRNHAKRSQNTADEYERDIRNFFQVIRNKTLESLERDDIKVSLSDVLDYQTYLFETNKYKNTTINRFISSVKSLYKFLAANEYEVNTHIFGQVKDLPDDTTNIGFLSPDEAKLLAELALEEKHNGLEKKALILLAASTSMRKSSIFEIQYDDIKKHESKEQVYIIGGNGRLFDKGKPVYKEIHVTLYNMLLEFRGDRKNSDKVFTISPSGLDQLIKRLCNIAGFDPRRNISVHSLKKSGVQYSYEASGGDMFVVQAQGGWSSPAVAAKHYLEKKSNIAGIGMFEETDPEVFDKLTQDEMLVLLKSFGNGIGAQLRGKAKDILNGRK